jgi:antitoxin PrlF
MPSATVTSKGQITIPKEVRERLRIRPGSVVQFYFGDLGQVHLQAKTRDISELAGILRRPGQKPVSVEEMNKAVREHVARKFR